MYYPTFLMDWPALLGGDVHLLLVACGVVVRTNGAQTSDANLSARIQDAPCRTELGGTSAIGRLRVRLTALFTLEIQSRLRCRDPKLSAEFQKSSRYSSEHMSREKIWEKNTLRNKVAASRIIRPGLGRLLP